MNIGGRDVSFVVGEAVVPNDLFSILFKQLVFWLSCSPVLNITWLASSYSVCWLYVYDMDAARFCRQFGRSHCRIV